MNGGFRVHAFDGDNVSKGRIGRGLWELRRIWIWSRVVADQMEMLASRGGDAERLLHQPVRLVSVPVRSITIHLLILVASSSTAVRGLASHPPGRWWDKLAPSSLALHLSIREKAAGNPACAP